MKSARVILAVLALLALPFAAASAQGRSNDSKCNVAATRSAGKAQGQGLATAPGQLKGCPAPNPDPDPDPNPGPQQPPTGIHLSKGFVYEDIDGNGSQDMSAGEMGLAGWTVQLYWNGQLVASTTSNADGAYEFPGLGASDLWSVCVVGQAGYNRTQPLNGDACGGAGYQFQVLESPFLTWYQRHFGMMMQ